LLWWAYAKAILNAALRAVGLKSAARFKTTLKTGAAVAAGGAGAPRAGGGTAPAAPRSPARRRVPPPAFDDDGGYGGGPAPGGALERVFTMPEVLAALAARPGERPAWDADAPPPSDAEYGSLTFESLRLGALRDVWAPLAAGAAAAAASVALTLALARGTAPPLAAVGALWGAASALPPALLLLYALGVRGAGARRACAAALALAALAGGGALLAAHRLAPADYDYGAVLGKAYLFYDAQKSGPLGGAANRVPWRGDSAMHDSGPRGADLVGGFYDAGDHIKASMSIGVSASLLAWGLLEFPAGHAAAGQAGVAAGHVRHAAEYLLKCHTKDEEFVAQVGGTGGGGGWGRAARPGPTTHPPRPPRSPSFFGAGWLARGGGGGGGPRRAARTDDPPPSPPRSATSRSTTTTGAAPRTWTPWAWRARTTCSTRRTRAAIWRPKPRPRSRARPKCLKRTTPTLRAPASCTPRSCTSSPRRAGAGGGGGRGGEPDGGRPQAPTPTPTDAPGQVLRFRPRPRPRLPLLRLPRRPGVGGGLDRARGGRRGLRARSGRLARRRVEARNGAVVLLREQLEQHGVERAAAARARDRGREGGRRDARLSRRLAPRPRRQRDAGGVGVRG